jgi:type VI secretion system secreted protein Hcp
MPGNAFITFSSTAAGNYKAVGDVKGESVQEGYKDWIDIGDWSWDVEAEHSVTKGTGAAVGKPTPGVLSFSKFYDRSSPTALAKMVKGVHFKSAVLVMCKQTGKKDVPEPYFWIVMSDVFTTKVANKGGEDGSVSQDIELVFKKVEINYCQQGNDGVLASPIPFEWDIGANKLLQGSN